MSAAPSFVPAGFAAPPGLCAPGFVLEPLGPAHNVADYAAWTSSIAHIRETPGFVGGSWPRAMSLEENLRDLERHARDFDGHVGFTYTVIDPDDDDVIGCVYIYPVSAADADAGANEGIHDASVRSWVRADRAALDEPLWRAVSEWLREEWPFEHVTYVGRT